MNPPARSINAWIFLDEDEPAKTSYLSPNRCYQTLITYGVYKSTDMVSACFANTVPISSSTVPPGDGSSWTIQLPTANHPDGYTDTDQLQWLVRDARAVNPNIKILIMLGYGSPGEISPIFSSDSSEWQQNEVRPWDWTTRGSLSWYDHWVYRSRPEPSVIYSPTRPISRK